MRKKIIVIGGDKRFQYLRGFLSKDFEVIPFPENNDDSFSLSDCEAADIIILPYPISFDGVSVNAPLYGGRILLCDLFSHLLPHQILLTGGRLPEGLPEAVCKVHDYTDNEELLFKNAELTAEGLLKMVIEESPKALAHLSVAVTGFGRVGRASAAVLRNVGCSVTVFARSETDRNKAKSEDLRAFDYNDFILLGENFDCIINSVPSEVLDEKKLESLRSDCLLFEAASAPYGTDFKAADKLRLKTVIAGSLPGKTSPETAAGIIYDSVMQLLEGG